MRRAENTAGGCAPSSRVPGEREGEEPACGAVEGEVTPVSPRLAGKDARCFPSNFTEWIPFRPAPSWQLGWQLGRGGAEGGDQPRSSLALGPLLFSLSHKFAKQCPPWASPACRVQGAEAGKEHRAKGWGGPPLFHAAANTGRCVSCSWVPRCSSRNCQVLSNGQRPRCPAVPWL